MATKVIHIKYAPPDWRDNPEYVYIGRPSKWGNPFPVQNLGRAGAVREHAAWLQGQKELLESIPELKDKTLVCFCKPEACHGDYLALLADNREK